MARQRIKEDGYVVFGNDEPLDNRWRTNILTALHGSNKGGDSNLQEASFHRFRNIRTGGIQEHHCPTGEKHSFRFSCLTLGYVTRATYIYVR
jgi:hypothetical protein